MIPEFIKKYKVQIIKLMLIILFIAGIYMVASNNYGFYDTPIGTVIDESSGYVESVEGKNGEEEKYYS